MKQDLPWSLTDESAPKVRQSKAAGTTIFEVSYFGFRVDVDLLGFTVDVDLLGFTVDVDFVGLVAWEFVTGAMNPLWPLLNSALGMSENLFRPKT